MTTRKIRVKMFASGGEYMERIIPLKETLTIEFKSDLSKLANSEFFEAVVAFANTEGGELYVGVEDDGTITGVHQEHLNPTTLSAFIANNTIPPISVRAEVVEDLLPVLKISVPKSYNNVVATSSGKILRRRLKADGTPENTPMFPFELATRLSDLRLLDYTALPIQESKIDDLDPIEIERLKKLILAYNGDKTLLDLENVELLKSLGFVREVGDAVLPTIAGILMVGKVDALKRHVPTMHSAFQVTEGTNVRVNDDFVLPILASIEKLTSYLEAWNQEREIEIGLFRMPAPDFDKRALREAIVNAYSHRDYSKMGRVRVAFSDDGLTIANPGGFIEGISVQNLLTAEPHGRNPLLADALKRIGLAEKTGRGIDRIYEGSLIYGRMLPDYSSSTTVTVSLFIPKSNPDIQIARMISNEQNRTGRPIPINTLLVLNALKDAPRATVEELAIVVNLTETIVKIILEKSVENGLVEAFGNGKGRGYILSRSVYSDDSQRMGYVLQKDIDKTRHLELIQSLARENEFVSKSDVVQLLHVSEDRAYYLIKKLVDTNILRIVQKGHYAKYQIVN